jgi:hypothetical protein
MSHDFEAWCSQHDMPPADCFDQHNPHAGTMHAETEEELHDRIVKQHLEGQAANEQKRLHKLLNTVVTLPETEHTGLVQVGDVLTVQVTSDNDIITVTDSQGSTYERQGPWPVDPCPVCGVEVAKIASNDGINGIVKPCGHTVMFHVDTDLERTRLWEVKDDGTIPRTGREATIRPIR